MFAWCCRKQKCYWSSEFPGRINHTLAVLFWNQCQQQVVYIPKYKCTNKRRQRDYTQTYICIPYYVGVLWNIEKHCTCIIVIQTRWADEVLWNSIMIYLFSRCYGRLFHRNMIMLNLFYLLYTPFMLNDQSTNSVVLKAKLQQQMYTWYNIIT